MWHATEMLPVQQAEVPLLVLEIKAPVFSVQLFQDWTEESSFLFKDSELGPYSGFEHTAYRLP